MSNGIFAGNVKAMTIVRVTADIGSVAANTSEEETVTVTGARIGDFVVANKTSLEAGIVFGSCRVTANDTVAIQVINTTASAINEASEIIDFLVIRPEARTRTRTAS